MYKNLFLKNWPSIAENFAERAIRTIALDQALKKYGNPVPKIIAERLDQEFEAIDAAGSFEEFFLAMIICLGSHQSDSYITTVRSLNYSLVAYFCWISPVNPLPFHRFCPECNHFETYDNDRAVKGNDMSSVQTCPVCGAPLISDGADIPPALSLRNIAGSKHDIRFNVAGEYRCTLRDVLLQAYGKDRVVHAGLKNEYGETDQVHPWKLLVFPEGYKTELPVTKVIQDDGTEILADEYDENDIPLKRIIIHALPELDLLHRLEQNIKADPGWIGIDDKDILQVFLSGDISFLPGTDKKGEANSLFKKLVEKLQPKTFSDLISVFSMMMGSNTWENNAETLVENGCSPGDLITNSDDLYEKLIDMRLSDEQAYAITESIRKGNGLSEDMKNLMRDASIPDLFIDSCKKIRFLVSRSYAAEYLMIAYKIAWYKLNYPADFQKILAATDMLPDDRKKDAEKTKEDT